jgi:DNA modification methylase
MNKVLFGDCRETMRKMSADGVRVQTCVTSPPYFGLRDYGVDGQLGLEQTPEQYIAAMVDVFRCVRDVLADDGTLWVNIGDSYARTGGSDRKPSKTATVGNTVRSMEAMPDRRQRAPDGLKEKDLIGIPWMLAFALRADGWFLRQDIIWHKPNPMPESVTDRCTKAHEYVFLLSKSARYFYDAEAVLEPCSPNTHARLSQNVQDQIGSTRAHGGAKSNGNMKAVGRKYDPGAGNKNNASFDAAMAIMPEKRNRRSVWTVATRPYKGAHFATFPPALIEPCILAGSRPGDIVLDPFMGSGTTAAVAIQHGRQYAGCELNKEYEPLQEQRIAEARAALLAPVQKPRKAAAAIPAKAERRPAADRRQLDIFEQADSYALL